MDDIYQTVCRARKRTVVDPNIRRSKHGNGVAVGALPVAQVGRGAAHHAGLARLAIVDANAVDDHMVHPLHRDARAVCYFNLSPTPIYGFEAIHDQLILQCDHHVPLEYDPKWLRLNHSIPQCAGLGASWVVGGIGDNVNFPKHTTKCRLAEAHSTVG